MFSYSAGRSAYPQLYSVSSAKKSPKRDPPRTKSKKEVLPTTSLQPAIDGPPSPERIRAYTEQMKRTSLFGNGSRSNTFSSSTPSSRSRDSVSVTSDTVLSRKSSSRSSKNMAPSKADRPDSIQIFGSIFTRSGRRSRKDTSASLSIPEIPIVEELSKDSNSKDMNSRGRRHIISTPYNFQHVTHTRQEHLPDLEHLTRTELVSGLSAIRASQVPTQGELKGIRALDLHFENFSSESLISPVNDDELPPAINPKSPRRQRSVLRKAGSPPRLQTQSQDNLRTTPPRPTQALMSPTCPIEPPARTSSRTASVLYDTFAPLATTTIERPHTNGGFRRPSPFAIRSPPPVVVPPPPSWSEQDVYFADLSQSHAVTTPNDEAWPLSASGTFGAELADVEEEDESGSRHSRISVASQELRMSQSVPSLRLKSQQQNELPTRAEARVYGTLEVEYPSTIQAPNQQQFPSAFHGIRDSWEDDVDFCYENEIEADFDYQWDTCDDKDNSMPQPRLEFHLEDNDNSTYHGCYRPSLLVPSALEIPSLSPLSNSSTTSVDPRTPNFLQPSHHRSPSHASSFKESHGFNLSPSLLIPSDYQSAMDQEALYNEHFRNHAAAGGVYSHDTFIHPVSPIDDSTSSAASYRSSAFSRGSARSSSSTRISTANSRASQDSMKLAQQVQKLAIGHRSVDSASSLPELIPSALRCDSDNESHLASTLASRNTSEEYLDSAPAPDVVGPAAVLAAVGHRRNKSLVAEPSIRKGINHFAPALETVELKSLSPVVESFSEVPTTPMEPAHGRNGSVPLAGLPISKRFEGRARASTTSSTVPGKPKGGYMLFPQI